MKNSCLLTRRAGTTRQAFREYYENNHAPLGARYFPFRKYLRNHVLEASTDIDFDVIMESYFDDDLDVAAINHGEARPILDKDERAFMAQEMVRPVSVDEEVLSGPPIDVAEPGTRRLMLLLNSTAAAGDPSFGEGVRRWAADWARMAGVKRVSLDTATLQAVGDGPLPFAAILSLWLEDGDAPIDRLAAPAAVKLETCVLTQVHETTPKELAARYGS